MKFKTIKDFETEIKRTKVGEIVPMSECENCGCELLKGQEQFCESCNEMSLQSLKKVLKNNEEIKKRLLKVYPLKTGMSGIDLKARNTIKEIFDIIKHEVQGD